MSFLKDWLDERYNHCVCTLMWIMKFARAHLVVGGWYSNCFYGSVSEFTEPFYNSLASSALEVLELENEPEEDKISPTPTIVKKSWVHKG